MNIERNHKYRKSNKGSNVSSVTYLLYLLYTISFFIHIPARVPVVNILRPDLLIALSIFFLLFMESGKLKGRLNDKCSKLLLIFFGYIFISLPLVEWPGSVLNESLSRFIKVFVFAFFTILIIDTRERLKQFTFVFVSCQVFRALEPLYLYLRYDYLGSATHLGAGEFAGRLSGAPSDVVNPNGLAFIIALTFPFLYYLLFENSFAKKILFLLLTGPMIYALILTLSRSGVVALGVVAWNIIIKSRHKTILLIMLMMAAIFSWNNMSDIARDRYLSLTGSTESRSAGTFSGRIGGVFSDFDVALNRPIVGHGVGTSQEAIFNVRGGVHVSHILYAEVIIETGIIGFVIYMLFLYSILKILRESKEQCNKYEAYLEQLNNSRIKNRDKNINFEKNLLNALSASFWMLVIFSLAQYGVSEFHWYLLAGFTVALKRVIDFKTIDT